MKHPHVRFLEWQELYGTEEACAAALCALRWPGGFRCPKCEHDTKHLIETRHLYQCAKCGHQVSVTAGTILHATKLPLVKWFWAIYLVNTYKKKTTALQLAYFLNVSWLTGSRMLKKLQSAMVTQDNIYRISQLIEFDDTSSNKKLPVGKQWRNAEIRPNPHLWTDIK